VEELSSLDITHTGWTMLRYQFIDAAHLVPSRSATIASIEVRSSAWRATMRAISAFNAAMSTTSRVSSCSTYEDRA